MTSPISTEDLEGMIPRGYVLSPASSGVYAAIDNNSSGITLGPGVHRLACTWEGPQTVGINVARDGVGTRRFAEFAGGGTLIHHRNRRQFLSRRAVLPRPRRHRAATTRYRNGVHNAPLTSGVVKHDHTTGSTGRYFAVRDSLQDKHWGLYGVGGGAARKWRVLHPARRCVSNSAGVHGAGGRRSVVEALKGRPGEHCDVSHPRRLVRGAAQLQTAHDSGERGGAAVDYHDPAPQRRRSAHIHRIPTHLPTTQIAAGGDC